MTTQSLPRTHSDRRSGRGLALITAALLVAGFSTQALAANPTAPQITTTVAGTVPVDATIAGLQQADLATSSDPAPASPGVSTRLKTVLQQAFSLLGTPYRWGGTSPEGGFDCSGLVGYVFRTVGINLPRVSRAMATEGTPIADREALAEGDLVFFGRNGRTVDHVGIYVGDGKFLHAPRTGRDVTVSSLASGYWSQKYLQARRIAVGS